MHHSRSSGKSPDSSLYGEHCGARDGVHRSTETQERGASGEGMALERNGMMRSGVEREPAFYQ